MNLSIICATSSNNVIGIENQLPWKLPADLQHFKRLTMNHPVIMGRKTYESIGRALPGRTNIILTRQRDYRADNCRVAHTFHEAISYGKNAPEIFVIGGATVYQEALKYANTIYLTQIDQEFSGDAFFYIDPTTWILDNTTQESFHPDSRNPYAYRFSVLHRRSGTRQPSP